MPVSKEDVILKALVIIDMQRDFTTGVLGNPETAAVVDKVAAAVKKFRTEEQDGLIFATLDTHYDNYLETQEGRNLPVPHCIKNSSGWELEPLIASALGSGCTFVEKNAFGAIELPDIIGKANAIDEFIIMGVCTDICVISNAMILKAAFPETPIRVISDCCAGVTPESHSNAIAAMKSCQVIID